MNSTPFLSICVPTYERAGLLEERLNQLERILRTSAHREIVEVLISDNASRDHTDAVVSAGVARLALLCPSRAYRQPQNVGAENNFKFLYDQAHGDYVWLFSDDDEIHEAEFDPLVADLQRYRPEVCLSSFEQTPWSADERVFMCGGQSTELITDLVEAAPYLVRFPEITMYVYRRRVLSAAERAAIERACAETAYWFVALSAMLLAHHEPRLLLRTANIGRCGPDHHYIRYSPRAWETLEQAALLGMAGHPRARDLQGRLPSHPKGVFVVGHLLRHCFGVGIIRDEVARSDYQWCQEHAREVWLSTWRNTVKLPLVFALFPVVDWYRRWSTRRGRTARTT